MRAEEINPSISKCPECGEFPTLGVDALTGKHSVACMNICCTNMKQILDDNMYIAMAKWDKWVHGVSKHIKDSTELSGGVYW